MGVRYVIAYLRSGTVEVIPLFVMDAAIEDYTT